MVPTTSPPHTQLLNRSATCSELLAHHAAAWYSGLHVAQLLLQRAQLLPQALSFSLACLALLSLGHCLRLCLSGAARQTFQALQPRV